MRRQSEEFWFEDHLFQYVVTAGTMIVDLLDENHAAIGSAAGDCCTRSSLKRADIAYTLAFSILEEKYGPQPLPMMGDFLPG